MSPSKDDAYVKAPLPGQKVPTPYSADNANALPVKPLPQVAEVKQEEAAKPVVILSELDSYITERMKEQPHTLKEVEAKVEAVEKAQETHHRLSLPAYFQEQSYDSQEKPGAYIFRWQFKEKRALDRALNVLGWTLVNRTYFAGAPRYLFSANGGVEVGDAILTFMPAKQALALRERPGQLSREKLESQTTQVEQDYVLMTGNPKDAKVYKPEMPPESVEESETSVAGVQVEGRDF